METLGIKPDLMWPSNKGLLMVMTKTSVRRTRRTDNSMLKARLALAALREDKAIAELCEQSEFHSNQMASALRSNTSCRGRNISPGA